jgi:hypothetical protein
MGPALRKLLEITSPPFIPDRASVVTSGFDRLGARGTEISEVLAAKNGFFCFESALHFFPEATVESSWGIHEWNTHELWKAEYYGLADDIFCFAEDIFGGQFCVKGSEIGIFNPETADFRALAPTLEEWASEVLKAYSVLTGYLLAHEWQREHGPLPVRSRLMPKRPFALGGEYALANLSAIDSLRLMKNLGNLARQIHDLPDGATIEFKIL